MEIFNLEKLSEYALIYIPKVVGAIITLIIGLWIIKLLVRQIEKSMGRKEMETSLKKFLISFINIGLKIVLLIVIAGMFGVQTTSFIAVLGALAFAVGMALQGSLGHFASGVLILLFKPYKVGDLVDIGGNIGTVEEVLIFNTILITPDNKKIIIPNGTVTSGVIINISGQGEIRVDMTFGIGYDDDIDEARRIILETASNCKEIIQEKPIDVLVSELADSSVNFSVRPWAKSEHYWNVYFFLQEEIKKAFDEAGIGIPFPQMDLHIQDNKPPT